MSGTDRLVRVLLDSISSKKKTAAYDTQATVLRVEGDTAWVHIPGGVDETPVKLTIAAGPGDTVQVRVSGGTAWITGNSSAPPTDDHTARQAVQRAEAAEQTVNEVARQTGTNAEKIRQQAETITRIDTTAVTGVIVQYAKSDSPTVAPTRGWSDASPTWESGKYIWQRTVTMIDGEQIISNVSCIQGAKGADGADGTSVTILGHYDTYAELTAAHPTGSAGDSYMVGADLYVWNGSAWENVGQIQGPHGDTGPKGDTGRGIASITPEYCLSTSNTTPPVDGWSATVPAYVEGRYYWTRSKIMWDDSDTPTYTTPVLDTAVTNANSAAYQALRRAGNAEDVANATKQYFWEDKDGVHISSEPDAPTATRNMLLNSLGMLFRRGANNLLALLTGTNPSVNIYDGRGNADSNVLAQFAASGVRIGKSGTANIRVKSDQVEINAVDGSTAATVSYSEHNYNGGKVYGVTIGDNNKKSEVSIYPEVDVSTGDVSGNLAYAAVMSDYSWALNSGGIILFYDDEFRVDFDETMLQVTNEGYVYLKGYTPPYLYEDVETSITYSAGTIGTRGARVSLGTTKKTGYIYMGATVIDHQNTSLFSLDIGVGEQYNVAYISAYRASGNAVDAAIVKVRKMWVSDRIAEVTG